MSNTTQTRRDPPKGPISRSWTFLAGFVAFVIFYVVLVNIASVMFTWDNFDSFLLMIAVFVTIFVMGITEVADRIERDPDGSPATAGFVGILYFFDSPAPFEVILPSGYIWTFPLFTSVRAVPAYGRELGINVPRDNKESNRFIVTSLSDVKFSKSKPVPGKRRASRAPTGKKFVVMEVKYRIRKRVRDPYLWITQNQGNGTVESTEVSLINKKIRELASNGSLKDNTGATVFTGKDDFDFMQKKGELGTYLKNTVLAEVERSFGEEIIDVVVTHLEPASPDLRKTYEKVARELAEETGETIELDNYIRQANRIMEDTNNPINTFDQAFAFVLANAGKITYDQLVVKGGKGGTIVPIVTNSSGGQSGGGNSPP